MLTEWPRRLGHLILHMNDLCYIYARRISREHDTAPSRPLISLPVAHIHIVKAANTRLGVVLLTTTTTHGLHRPLH